MRDAEHMGPIVLVARAWLGNVGAKALAADRPARKATAVLITKRKQNGGHPSTRKWRTNKIPQGSHFTGTLYACIETTLQKGEQTSKLTRT